MNLYLHMGLLGSFEAALIAFGIGLLAYALMHVVCRRAGGSRGHAIGSACLLAIAVGAGIDLWKMFYLSVMQFESPLYARIALADIHDPDQLGTRVVLELAGALCGVGVSSCAFSLRSVTTSADSSLRDTDQSPR